MILPDYSINSFAILHKKAGMVRNRFGEVPMYGSLNYFSINNRFDELLSEYTDTEVVLTDVDLELAPTIRANYILGRSIIYPDKITIIRSRGCGKSSQLDSIINELAELYYTEDTKEGGVNDDITRL